VKVNISAISRKHGISRESLRQWRDQGLDLADDAAVAERVSIMRKTVAQSTAAPADGGESLAEAKRRRAVADADFSELRARREAGLLIEVAAVEESFARVGSIVRSKLLSWQGTLPNQLEGMAAVGISKVLGEEVRAILEAIHASR
jgi:transposase-like protein